jgi:hypothetical protein
MLHALGILLDVLGFIADLLCLADLFDGARRLWRRINPLT